MTTFYLLALSALEVGCFNQYIIQWLLTKYV